MGAALPSAVAVAGVVAGVAGVAGVKSCAVWSGSSTFGNFSARFGAFTPSAGLALSSRRSIKKANKLRTLDRWRAMERGDSRWRAIGRAE